MVKIADLARIRAEQPELIGRALKERAPGPIIPQGRKAMIIAADHPARGALSAGDNPMAMADRTDLLERILEALSRPGVTGFLGTADMIEDLALLGALEGKAVFGSMNRAGLAGSSFEIDDRFTGYDAQGIADAQLDGGKMLTRINLDDAATPGILERTANAVNELAERQLIAMVEPFMNRWNGGGVENDLMPEAVMRSIAIAAGLGRTSAYTWLKLPCVENMEQVMEASTLPALILGGEVASDHQAVLEGWAKAVRLPNIFGLIIGRSLLYPADGDVAKAVDNAVELL